MGALTFGLADAIATTVISSFCVVAFSCGVVFGAGGWLVEFFSGFRKLGDQLSSWALIAGGVVVLFSMRRDIESGSIGLSEYYAIPLQYVSAALICWGLLMFAVRGRRHALTTA
jgi:hypothetical protein